MGNAAALHQRPRRRRVGRRLRSVVEAPGGVITVGGEIAGAPVEWIDHRRQPPEPIFCVSRRPCRIGDSVH